MLKIEAPAFAMRWPLASVRVSTPVLIVAGITGVGLALRLTWALYADTIPLGGDPRWYYVVGINLAKGYGFVTARDEFFLEKPGPGFVTAFWPPGYPFVLAAIFKTFGVSITAAKVFNALFGAATVPFVYALGRRIFDARTGLIAAGIFAVFPNAISWTPLLFPEEFFTLLLVAALWLLVAFPPGANRHWPAVAGFGVLMGIAALTRGQAAVLVPVAAVFWLGAAGWRPALRASAVSLLIAAAVIAPWTIRNAVQMNAFIPISTNSAAALRAGHAPDATGTTGWPRDRIDGFYMWQSLYRPDWEVKGYREYTKRGLEYAFTHPGHETELTGSKIYHLYRSDSDIIPWLTTLGATPLEPDGLDDALRRAFDYAYYALFFAAIASVPLWLRRNPARVMLISIVAFWTLFHIAFLSEPRYHVPLYPVFAIAAAAGVSTLLTYARRAIDRRGAPAEAT